jgi:hypothetical protein
LICEALVIADAVVIAAPPIRTARNEGLSAQPPTIVVGVVIGAVAPDPNTVPEYPMTVMEPVKVVVVVVVALRKAPVIEPITVAMVVALGKSTAVSMIVTTSTVLGKSTAITVVNKSATITAFREPGSTHSRASKITATHSRPMATAVTACHCTGMATGAAMTTAAMTTATMHPAAAARS